MMRQLMVAGAAIVLVAATPHDGGWAVVTVHDVPNHLVVGRAQTITFSVRQHGAELTSGLAPNLLVRRADAGFFSRDVTIRATPTRQRGVYQASYTPTEAGLVELEVDTEFRARVVLRPIQVVATGAVPAAVSAEERGRQLFKAAGCMTCHAKTDDALLDDPDVIEIAPALTGRTFPVEILVQKILDPNAVLAPANQRSRMPQLEVSRENALAIAAYLNARQVASR